MYSSLQCFPAPPGPLFPEDINDILLTFIALIIMMRIEPTMLDEYWVESELSLISLVIILTLEETLEQEEYAGCMGQGAGEGDKKGS